MLILFITFCSLQINLSSQVARDSCDWNRIDELGEIFQDALGPKPLVDDDPNSDNYGQLIISRSSVPFILASEYFERCLRGRTPDFFTDLLGATSLDPTTTVHGALGYQLEYGLQLYDVNGDSLDPMPSSFRIQFDKEKRAITMFEESY